MRNRQNDHYDRHEGGRPVLQILESHTIQELIKGVSDFPKDRAREKTSQGLSANIDSAAIANDVKTYEDIGAMKTVVITKTAESSGHKENRK